ncbi:hypothetical protein [Dongia sp.]|uniref:hypothetical protein n=1 Tax=Dongia sp. TaxID=1977262 RepID=UPI0035AF5358
MAEIGPLLLPPPAAISGRSAVVASAGSAKAGDRENAAAQQRTEAVGDASGNSARAKQFRFRVVDGGRSDTLGNAELPATSRQQTGAADEAQRGAQDRDTAGGKSSSLPLGTFSAPFLAQLIAQEQLKPGLYDPPVKQADRAYRQAGAEPALTDDATATAHFKIAV